MRTKDGGATWTIQKNDFPHTYDVFQSQYVQKIYSLDSLNIVAVGDSGLILRTMDAGETWVSQHVKENLNFFDVYLADSSTGIATGGAGLVSITTDAGKTWHDQYTPGGFYESIGHAFDSMNFCAINAFDTLDVTTDRGLTWTSSQIVLLRPNASSGWYRSILAAHFFSRTHAIAVGIRDSSGGEGALAFVTEDGGATWEQTLDSVTKAAGEFLCIDFADSLFGIGGTRNNYCYVTTDGGNSWQVDSVNLSINILREPGPGMITSISFGSPKMAFAILSGGPRAYIARFDRTNEAVSTNKDQTTKGITVYPNPVEDAATIVFESIQGQSYNLTLTNMLGETVWSKYDIHSNSVQFRRSDLPSGVYLFRLEGIGTALTGHVVLTH
jgi:photosystem II stability/assembly factor-like uncharacterized protein